MRKATRTGSAARDLEREPVLGTVEQLLDAARAEFGGGDVERRAIPQQGVRPAQERARLLVVIPEGLSQGDHAREPLGAGTLLRGQPRAALEGRDWHDAIHERRGRLAG